MFLTNMENFSATNCVGKYCDEKLNLENLQDVNTRTYTVDKWFHRDNHPKSLERVTLLTSQPESDISEKLYQHDQFRNSSIRSSNSLVLTSTHSSMKCDFCSKSCISSSQCKEHNRTHAGEKPYQCDLCPKSFANKPGLDYHIRTHTGEKPYQCELCLKFFTDKSSLTRHTRTHTGEKPHQCELCLKSFTQKGNLTKHTRTHTGEKPYQCKLCLKCYTEKRNLTKHTRTHIGEKPYQCELCLKSFTKKIYLQRHNCVHSNNNQSMMQSELTSLQLETLTTTQTPLTSEKQPPLFQPWK